MDLTSSSAHDYLLGFVNPGHLVGTYRISNHKIDISIIDELAADGRISRFIFLFTPIDPSLFRMAIQCIGHSFSHRKAYRHL